MNKFLLKDNQLKDYALRCGYLQQATDTGEQYNFYQKVELSKNHNTYEVFYMNYKTHDTEKFYIERLSIARKEWKRLVKKYNCATVCNKRKVLNNEY